MSLRGIVSVVVIALLVISGVPAFLGAGALETGAPLSAGKWTQSTKDDFLNGTLVGGDLEVRGEMSGGSLVLKKDAETRVVPSPGVGKRPDARTFHAMSYDQAAGVMVLFGGSSMSGPAGNDTWAYDLSGNQWTELFPKSTPPARYGHTLVYMKDFGLTAMFGGFRMSNDQPQNDLWVFNTGKNTWVNITPAVNPVPRRGYHAMSYDESKKLVIIFGGAALSSGTNTMNDTWEYDPVGNKWNGPVTGPAQLKLRSGHSMAYNPTVSKTVMFGGRDSTGGLLNDTWLYGGGTWTRVVPFSSPGHRTGFSMTFDALVGETVIFSGQTLVSPSSDIWGYDAGKNTWNQHASSSFENPAPTTNAEMVFDHARSVILMFGGFAMGEQGDLWMLDSANKWWWTNTTSRPWPSMLGNLVYRKATDSIVGGFGFGTYSYDMKSNIWARLNGLLQRDETTAIYHDPTDRLILFGGANGMTRRNDTQAFNFTTNQWTSIPPTGMTPPPMSRHSMVYDEIRNKVLLFGGSDAAQKFDGTWLLNPATGKWTESLAAPHPMMRDNHAIAIASGPGVAVLFGGNGTSGLYNDTWIFDMRLEKWTDVTPAHSPSKREGHSIVFDSINGQVILFGGKDESRAYLNDVWAYNITGNTWSMLFPATAIPPRWKAASTFAIPGGTAYIGYGKSAAYFDDLWAFPAYRQAGAYESSRHDTGMSLFTDEARALKNPGLTYKKIWWNNTGPFASVLIQLRTASTKDGLNSSQWYGPAGTGDYYTVPGTDINPIHKDASARWIQYRLSFNASNPGVTPEFRDITITYDGDLVVGDFPAPVLSAILMTAIVVLVCSATGEKRSRRLRRT
jgi:N-acetylneuraminic acid mutarotase